MLLGFILGLVHSNSLKFAVLGDWAYLPSPDNAKDTMDAVKDEFKSENFEFFITVGDNIYDDGLTSKDDKHLE